jgi:hypothetical protein
VAGAGGIVPVVAKDEDDEAYWRRIYAEKHPEPVPFLVNGGSAKLAERYSRRFFDGRSRMSCASSTTRPRSFNAKDSALNWM